MWSSSGSWTHLAWEVQFNGFDADVVRSCLHTDELVESVLLVVDVRLVVACKLSNVAQRAVCREQLYVIVWGT